MRPSKAKGPRFAVYDDAKETTTRLPYCTVAWSLSFRGWSHKSQS